MQHAHPDHSILHILQLENILEQAVAVHMSAAESQLGPFLDLLDQPLALHPFDGEADDGHTQVFASRWLAVDGDDAAATLQEVQQDRLQFLLIRSDLRPCTRRIRAKVVHYPRDALHQLIVHRCKVELDVERLRQAVLEEVGQRVDVRVRTGRRV